MRVKHSSTAGGWETIPIPPGVGDRVVYHYTNATAFLGILSSRSLWASSPVGLNDLGEFTYGVAAIRQAWDELGARTDLSLRQRLFMEEVSRSDLSGSFADYTYVLSATSDPDSLNQWQGYSGRQGYAVGLRTSQHLAVLDPAEKAGISPGIQRGTHAVWGWYEVIYDRARQRELALDLINFYMDRLDDFAAGGVGMPVLVAQATGLLASLAAIFKHEGFHGEREVRYVASVIPELEVDFRASAYGVVPYVQLVASSTYGNYVPSHTENLPIEQVVVGPLSAEEGALTRRATDRMLARYGYCLKSRSSDLPYRF